ncbi:hypothetical protein JXA05_03645 [Candidatus Peregrinibacteria bacterium]|nr:hypothetical protein [Candidatus Peregrinibacteria bacterium]
MAKKLHKTPLVSPPKVRIISTVELRDNRGEIFSEIAKGVIFLVRRRTKILFVMRRYDKADNEPAAFNEESFLDDKVKIISPLDIKDNRGSMLEEASMGMHFIIERKGKKMAVLGPYEEAQKPKTTNLTLEQVEKLDLVKGFSAEELKLFLDIVTGKVSIRKLLKARINKKAQ